MSNEYDRFGSARWASAGDIHKSGLGKSTKHSVFCGFNPYENKPLMLNGDGHVTILGGAGAGKGAGLVMYSALGFGWQGSSIINDLKGEIAACTIHNLHKQGKKGYCINPFGLHGSKPWYLPQHRINPLDILKPDSLTLTADLTLIFAMLIKISGDEKNSYFENKARLWCRDIALYILITTGKVSLPDIYKIICMAEAQPDYFARFAKGEMMTLGVGSVARTAMEMVNKRIEAPREYSPIMGTIIDNLAWLDDPAMNEAVSHTDFSLNDLLDNQTQIYIILPAEYVSQYSTFLRLIIGVGMIVKRRKPHADPVLFLIDEAGQMGYFEALENAYTVARGGGVRTVSAFQSIGQMNCYPAKHQTILGSSTARIFMGTRDLDTARMVSDMIGAETLEYDAPRQQADAAQAKTRAVYSIINGGDPFIESYNAAHFSRHETRKEKIRRPLLGPDEVLNFPENSMILLTSGIECPPIRARKIPYWQRRELAGQYLPNPFHPPASHVVTKSMIGSRKRQVITQEVPRELEHWPQFQKGFYSFIK